MGFNDKKQTRRGASFHESAVTILTSGCHFNGKLYCRGSSRIGGKIEGEIISEGLLIIEEEAMIAAEIKADEVVIQGHVEGQLEAQGRVRLESNSKFFGDIVTPSLVIKEGAIFNGKSKMLNLNETVDVSSGATTRNVDNLETTDYTQLETVATEASSVEA